MFPYSHKGTIILSEASGPASALAQEQLCPVLRSSASRGRMRSREGLRARHPAKHISSKTGRKVWFAAPRLGHVWCKYSQPLVTLLLYLMIQLQLRMCIIPPAPAWLETFPISFRDEKSIWRGAKKDPQWSEPKNTSKSASENSYHACPYSIPSAEGCTLPAVIPWQAPRQTHTRRVLCGRESRSENSRHLAGGSVTNPWQSTKPKAILKSATGIWQLWKEPPRRSRAFTMLCEGGCGSWGASTWWERTVRQEDAGQTWKHYHWSKHC